MDVQSMLSYIGTKKIENVLTLVYGIHKQALDNKSLRDSFQVNFMFSSGLTTRGYIIGFNKKDHLLTLANFSDGDQSYYVQYLELHGIQSIGIEHFEKSIESFCENKIPEGLGVPPTVLSLKRELQELQKTLHSTFQSALEVTIKWEEIDKEAVRTIWAIDGILKQLAEFNLLVKNDPDFIEAFNESVKSITINDAQESSMSINQGVFTISFEFSSGLVNVTKAETIKNFLFEKM